MTMLEDALRETFASRVAHPPAVDDPATVAIRRATAIRRRRAAVTSVTAVLVLVLAVGTALSLRSSGRPASVLSGPALPPPASAPVSPQPGPVIWPGLDAGADLRVGAELWTAAGGRVPLLGTGVVSRTYRTAEGWVYGSAQQVRLLRDNGASVELLGQVQQWLISQDGQRLAALSGNELRVAAISGAGLVDPVSTWVPSGTTLEAFPDERVVLGGPDRAWLDYWHPEQPYRATPTGERTAVYGAAGGDLIGVVQRAGDWCLVVLEIGPRGMEPGPPERCGLGLGPPRLPALGPHRGGWVSPDERWLAVPDRDQVQLIDLSDSAEAGVLPADGPVTCPVFDAVAPIWLDAETVLTMSPEGVVRCRVDGQVEVFALPGSLPAGWQFVPVLGASG